MAQATPVFEDKEVRGDGAIVEMRIWQVPAPVPPSTHLFKYALYYGRPGRRIVLFDNERGKGDHVHLGDTEKAYRFVSPQQLIEDFKAAVRAASEE